MNRNLIGLFLSLALIALTFVVSYLVSRKENGKLGKYTSEVARKVVHIGVSNWFFIYYYFFESFWLPVISLAVVALLNIVVNKAGGFKVLMGQKSEKRNWGLVHYPISIIIMMVLVEYGIGNKVALGCGLLGMGYGDGLAAIMGMRFGKKHITEKNPKTWIGFLTMFVVVTVISTVLNLCMSAPCPSPLATLLLCMVVGAIASVTEAFTPYGLDNISVPLVIFLLVGLI